MEHKDPEVRLEALSFIQDFREADVNAILMKALTDENTEVIKELANIFTHYPDFGGPPIYQSAFEGLKHPNKEIREQALYYLAQAYTIESVSLLIEALKSPYPDVVTKAAALLRILTNADIESTDYQEWLNWWEQHQEELKKELQP